MANNNNDHLFEDVPYQAPNASQDALFDDNSHLFEDTPHPESKGISTGRAALVGAGQGATFGFGEEITAPIAAAVGMSQGLPSESPEETTWQKYQRLMQTYRDTAREEQNVAQEQHPIAYTGGALAGGLASMKLPGLSGLSGTIQKGVSKIPGAVALPTVAKVASGAIEGAGIGGVYGAGEAQGNVEDRAIGAEEGAKTGAMVGAAVPLAGKALSGAKDSVSKTAETLGELPWIKKPLEAFKRGTKGENLVTEAGRKEASNIVRNESESLFNDIKKLQKDTGTSIADAIDSASESGTKIDLTEQVKTVLDKLKQIKAEGSKEASAYASGIESEIKKILGLKEPEIIDDLSKIDLPEGLSLKAVQPKAEPIPEEILVDPKKAQDLKQVLSDYTPKRGMAPQELEPARAAGSLSKETGEQLSETVEGLPELNKQYGLIKDSLKRLGVKEKNLPTQIVDKINGIISKIENEDITGDTTSNLIKEVLANIDQVDPNIAAKHSSEINDIVKRLKLASEINKGFQNFGWGTLQSLNKGAANVAGLAMNKTGINKLGPVLSKAIDSSQNFAQTILNSPTVKTGLNIANANSPNNLKDQEQHVIQRKVANASEKADPETLVAQAQSIREKYGKSGEQLAMILDNMSKSDKDARRALMFTVLQNQAYRRMLGISQEEK